MFHRRRSARRTAAIMGAALVSASLVAGLTGTKVRTAAASTANDDVIPFFGSCPHGGGTNCVVDGNTFYYGPDKIRLANIVAPDRHPPACAAEIDAGHVAANRLRDLLNSGHPTVSSIDRDKDIYGRKLRTVAVGGADIGATLAKEGLAHLSTDDSPPGWC